MEGEKKMKKKVKTRKLSAWLLKVKNTVSPSKGLIIFLIACVFLIGVAIAMLVMVSSSGQKAVIPTPTPTPSSSVVHDTWKMEGISTDTSWVTGGIKEIYSAKTPADAEKAVKAWVDRIKCDPVALVGAVQYLLQTGVDRNSLVDEDGWATSTAVSWVVAIQAKLGEAIATIGNVPNGWTNSGTWNGIIVPTSVIDKPLKAIILKFKDGTEMAIIGLCGNIATPNKPILPTPPPTPKPTPTPTPTLKPTPTPTPYSWSWAKPRPTLKPTSTPTPTPHRSSGGSSGGSHSTRLTPKDVSPVDYGRPGGDTTQNAGSALEPTATMVPRPIITPAPSTKPTPVQTSRSNSGSGSRVTDSSTSALNSPSGVTASGSSNSSTADSSGGNTAPAAPRSVTTPVAPPNASTGGLIANPF